MRLRPKNRWWFSVAHKTPATPRRHCRRPHFEPLEDRALATLGFTSAFGLAASFPSADHVALDAAGDTYVTGGFSGTANFDPGSSAAGIVSGSPGVESTFVAKYSPANALLWVAEFATAAGGATGAGSRGTGIALDNNTGAVYVVGQFLGSVDFNPGGAPLMLTSVSAQGDSYIVELSPDGTTVPGMLKQYGGSMASAEFNNLTLSSDGTRVFVTGGFTGPLDFDPGGTDTTLTSPTDGDAFVLALTSTLGFVFVQEANLNSAEAFGIAVDDTGFVTIAGTVVSSSDAFAARFDTFGNLNARRLFLGTHPTTMAASATSLVSDGTNLYLAGTFKGIGVNFNATTGTQAVTLDSLGQTDAFLLKLDPQLNIVWARRFGSTNADSGAGLAIDGSNNLYLTGFVSGLSSFGTNGLGTVIFDPGNGLAAMPDTYVLEVDSNGNFITPIGPQGAGTSRATGIAANSAGQVVIVGSYFGTAIFGGTSLQVPGITVPFVVILGNLSGTTGGGNGGGSGGGGGGTGSGIVADFPPTFVKERRLRAGKGRKLKIVGFQLIFSSALDAAVAVNVGDYLVIQRNGARHPARRVIPVLSASLNAGANVVTLTLGKYDSSRPLYLTGTGLVGAEGASVATVRTAL